MCRVTEGNGLLIGGRETSRQDTVKMFKDGDEFFWGDGGLIFDVSGKDFIGVEVSCRGRSRHGSGVGLTILTI